MKDKVALYPRRGKCAKTVAVETAPMLTARQRCGPKNSQKSDCHSDLDSGTHKPLAASASLALG